jgi:hypothetical protein
MKHRLTLKPTFARAIEWIAVNEEDCEDARIPTACELLVADLFGVPESHVTCQAQAIRDARRPPSDFVVQHIR